MPITPTYPGIYIQELQSNTHTIVAASTSTAVFVGYSHPFKTKPDNWGKAIQILSFSDYERQFGGFFSNQVFDGDSAHFGSLAHAVYQFFLNGGTTAYVIGLHPGSVIPQQTQATIGGIDFYLREPTDPNHQMQITITPNNASATTADITITYGPPTSIPGIPTRVEVYRKVSLNTSDPNYIKAVIGTDKNPVSSLVNVLDSATFSSFVFEDTWKSTNAPTAKATVAGIDLYLWEPTDQIQQITVKGVLGSKTADIIITYIPVASPLHPPEIWTYPGVSLSPSNPNYIKAVIGTHENPVPSFVYVLESETFSTFTFPPQTWTSTPAAYNPPVTTMVGGIEFTLLQPIDANNQMQISVTPDSASTTTADITITYTPAGSPPKTETYHGVSLNPSDHHYIETVIGTADALVSKLVFVSSVPSSFSPGQWTSTSFTLFSTDDFTKNAFQSDGPLDNLPNFNILVIPGVTDTGVLGEAIPFCEKKRAFFIMDPPPDKVSAGSSGDSRWIGTYATNTNAKSPNAALYFPYIVAGDPITGQSINLPPSGTVAGIYARTDTNRGVWKAPAGLETILANVTGVVPRGVMNDARQGTLNPLGVNCLRTFPSSGTVVFGARTIVGADTNTAFQQWKYVPVRRMTLFIEQTLYNNLGWVIFEPNDEPLWIAIRTSIESFMLSLFNQQAFQGSKPSEAFQVKCDSSTTTQDDINKGVVNIIVAFAPLKPAEFVIIKIAQLAGQAQS